MSRKYRELVELLEDTGVLQLDQPWAEEIKDLIESHKKIKPPAFIDGSERPCSGCGSRDCNGECEIDDSMFGD